MDQDKEKLIQLALEMDRRLADQSLIDSAELIDTSTHDLDVEQQHELQRLGEALDFVHEIRRHLGVLQQMTSELSDDDSLHRSAAAKYADASHEGQSPDGPTTEKKKVNIPSRLGRFDVIDVLGQGGFSRVFLAVDAQLDRKVALKVPLPHVVASETARRRFQREAKAAAILSHPAIVPIYESGTAGPVSYIAFGYCRGQNLSEWFSEQGRQIPPRTAAVIIAALAEAAEHAHQRGIVHRDLKPANILVEASEDADGAKGIEDRIRIADFGLARLDSATDESLTIEGAVIGTPAYMSPEQARGEASLDATTDIYSLGVMLYELLSGRPPFLRATHIATLKAIESEAPKRLRERKSTIPRDLEAICLKAMQKRAQDRYASAFALSEDLRRWLGGIPIHARRVAWYEKCTAWVQRNPAIATALTAAFLSLSVGLGIAVWQRQNALANLAESQRQKSRAETHLVNAQEVIDEIIQMEKKLRHSTEFAQLRGDLIRRAAILQSNLMERETQDLEVVYRGGVALSNLSPLLIELGEDDRAIANAKLALNLFERVAVAEEKPRSFNPMKLFVVRQGMTMNLVDLYSRKQKYAEAAKLIEGNLKQPHPDFMGRFRSAVLHAENYRSLSNVYITSQQTDKAIEALKHGLDRLAEFERPDDKRQAWDYDLTKCRLSSSLAEQLKATGDLENAEEQIQESISIVPRLFAAFPESPFAKEVAASVDLTRAGILAAQGELEEAVQSLRAGRDAYRDLLAAVPDYLPYAFACIRASVQMVDHLTTLGNTESAEKETAVARELFEGLSDELQSRSDIVQWMDKLGG